LSNGTLFSKHLVQ